MYNKRKETHYLLKFYETDQKVMNSNKILQEKEILQKIENLKKYENFPKFFGLFKNFCAHQNKIPEIFLQIEDLGITMENILLSGMQYNKATIRYIFVNLMNTLHLLHSNAICLISISPNNLVLVENNQEQRFLYKFFDFSNAFQLESKQNLVPFENFQINPLYLSPEIEKYFNKQVSVESKDFDPYAADIYSLGLLFIRIMGYKNPKKELIDGLLESKDFLNKYEEFLEILKLMLNDDPEKRSNVKNLLEILLKGENISNLENFEEVYNEEKKFRDLYLEEKERKNIRTSEDLKNVYFQHKEIYHIYKGSLNCTDKEKYHIQKAFFYLKEIQNKYQNAYLNGQIILEETEEIFCLKALAEVHINIGEFEKSVDLLKKSIEICEKIQTKFDDRSKIHEEYAESSIILARAYSELGQISNAEDCAFNSLNIFLKLDLENQEKVSDVYETMGLIYEKNEDYEKSDENYEKCLEIRVSLFGENHVKIANIYNKLGNLNFQRENCEQSEYFFKKTIEIRENLLGVHKDTGFSYMNLGNLYKEMWIFDLAEENLLKAVAIFKDLFGEKSKQIDELYETLIDLYGVTANIKKKEKKLKEAEEIYNKALELAKTKNKLYSMFLSHNLKNLYQKDFGTTIKEQE